ncbi:ABC-2 type transport system ATP-binding protein [Chitinophaga ginsengisegetis]|uniref:ABC-2 type transport system ATP-binding protein n=1 Tax=Chitinophaga ginsengisegetis TaxID=393003 RepID=A0A1T5N6R9_9BACT|nr:ABC transporter ATP-binding protein [Chitinophaga ginsengisegetis]SKC96024.1 ABC-2 type transport system ATP-binding protein [Chitinophaga ginsengisegetis]
MEHPIIEMNGLTKYYGSLKAVDNLHLSIGKGEIFGLLGPNGAGKSTTILMLLGLTEPSAGEARICGINASRNPIPVKRKVGYMPDSVGFYNELTALENLTYIGRLNGIPETTVADVARNMLEEVGLGAAIHKKTGVFSRGMKQRLGLAEVLIKQPEVIILDEPTLGIDPTGVRDFLELIRQLNERQGLTILLSSHHLHQVQQVCNRVGIFVGGRLLAEGNIETLAANLFQAAPYVVQVTVKTPVGDTGALEKDLLQMQAVSKVTVDGAVVEISGQEDITPGIVRFFVGKGFDVTGVQQKSYGLDEIYQQYFENNLKENTSNEKSGGLFQRSFFGRFKKR